MVAPIDADSFTGHLELTLLRPVAVRGEIEALCAIARRINAAAVCVNGSRVAQAYALLEDTTVKVSAAVGFPLGAMDADAKRYEIEAAVDAGAQEFDAVVNHGWIKDGDDKLFVRELRDLIEAADERPVKFVIEPALLAPEEILRVTKLVRQAGAFCIGAATGFGPRLATLEDLKLIRAASDEQLAIKLTATLLNRSAAEEMISAGALRLGLIELPANLVNPGRPV